MHTASHSREKNFNNNLVINNILGEQWEIKEYLKSSASGLADIDKVSIDSIKVLSRKKKANLKPIYKLDRTIVRID